MGKGRLEAFSDGVIAVIITIMVLELRTPHAATIGALVGNWPTLLSYVLSFVFVGIFWVNHHHMLQTVERVNGRSLWANLHLLFWLSLFPFVTSWMSEAGPLPSAIPVACYGVVLLMAGVSWIPLQRALISANGGADSELAKAVGRGGKEYLALILDVAAIVLAFLVPVVSCMLFVAVAAIWFIPDRRIEGRLPR
jgi:uncharacterized membrane protein